MDSELARGCVNKLLLEVALDLELSILQKLQFSYSRFGLP